MSAHRRSGAALAAVVAITLVLTSCQVARVGTRCRPGFGRDGTHVLICKEGRWARWMTIRQYLELVQARQQQGGAAPAAPGPNGLVRSWRADGVGRAVVKVGNVVYVGGEFGRIVSPDGSTSVARRNLAAFDATTGALLGGFDAGPNGRVRALASDGSRLFVGGEFTSIGGKARHHVAALDLTTGAALSTWSADADDVVYSLAHTPGRLYVAGNFSNVGGTARRRVAAVSSGTGAVASFRADTTGGGVAAIAASPDGARIYLGGEFDAVNGTSVEHLAAVDSNGTLQGVRFAGARDPVLDLTVAAGGGVAAAFAGEGSASNQVAWFDPITGRPLWSVRCSGDGQAVHTIGGSVFSGFHGSCGGDPTAHLVTTGLDGALRPFKPKFDGFWGVWDITGDATALVIAGDFTNIDGVFVRGFAIYRPAPT